MKITIFIYNKVKIIIMQYYIVKKTKKHDFS